MVGQIFAHALDHTGLNTFRSMCGIHICHANRAIDLGSGRIMMHKTPRYCPSCGLHDQHQYKAERSMAITGQDSFKTRAHLDVGGKSYEYFSLVKAQDALGKDISRLPFTLKVLLESISVCSRYQR